MYRIHIAKSIRRRYELLGAVQRTRNENVLQEPLCSRYRCRWLRRCPRGQGLRVEHQGQPARLQVWQRRHPQEVRQVRPGHHRVCFGPEQDEERDLHQGDWQLCW